LLGATALLVLLLGKTLFKQRPIALFVLTASIVLAAILRLDERGVALLGEVPKGVPGLSLPRIGRADIQALLPLSLACFLLAAVETSAIGRMFTAKHGYRLDATQEFLAIGSANLLAGLGAGFPVSGGSSQSLVNEAAGARTPLSGLFAALITLLVALFLTGLLRSLPQPVVAAIVLAAITGLIEIHKPRDIWRFSRQEFAIAVSAFLAVLGAGLLDGVLIGVAISILLLMHRAARPPVIEVGRVPGTSYFSDLVRHPENERVMNVLVVRPEGSLLYFNVDYARDRLNELVSARATPPRLVVLLLSNVPFVDLAGTEFLIDAHDSLARQGITVRLAEARAEIRDALRRQGGESAFCRVVANKTVDDVLRDARHAA